MALGFSQSPLDPDAVAAGDYANLPTAMQAGGQYSIVAPTPPLPAVVAAASAPAPQADPAAAAPPPPAAAPPPAAPAPAAPAALTPGPAARALHRMLGIDDGTSPQPGQALAPAPFYKPGFFETLFNTPRGGTWAQGQEMARAAHDAPYMRAVQIQQFRNAQGVVEDLGKQGVLSGAALDAARSDPLGTLQAVQSAQAERMKPAMLNAGQYRDPGLGGGPGVFNPVVGFDPVSGRGYSATPQGLTPLGPTLSGGYSEDQYGNQTSSRVPGPVGPRLPVLNKIGPAESLVETGGPGDGAPSAAAAAAAGPQPGATRGDRNLNPGNVRPPPQGMWKGQTGVDADGYAVFSNVADGQRAADKNLSAYGRRGVTTPTAIANRWASTSPPAERAAKAAAIAKAAGVSTSDSLDLSNPAVRAKVLPAIYATEGTSVAGQPASAPAAGGAPSMPPGPRVLAQGKGYGQPYRLPGTDEFVVNAPDGKPTHVGAVAYGRQAADEKYSSIKSSKQYAEYSEAKAAYSNITSNMAMQGGMSDYAIGDNFVRLQNPGMGAKIGNMEMVNADQGLPDKVKGELQAVIFHGQHFTPETRQLMERTSRAALASRYAALAPQLDDARAYAKQHGLSEADVVPSVIAPAPMDVKQRSAGQVYATPKGDLLWTGTGWRKAS